VDEHLETALLAQYADMKRWLSGPAIDEITTIEPPDERAIARPACFTVRNVPVRFTSRT
jgi:hypothetical protein